MTFFDHVKHFICNYFAIIKYITRDEFSDGIGVSSLCAILS